MRNRSVVIGILAFLLPVFAGATHRCDLLLVEKNSPSSKLALGDKLEVSFGNGRHPTPVYFLGHSVGQPEGLKKGALDLPDVYWTLTEDGGIWGLKAEMILGVTGLQGESLLLPEAAQRIHAIQQSKVECVTHSTLNCVKQLVSSGILPESLQSKLGDAAFLKKLGAVLHERSGKPVGIADKIRGLTPYRAEIENRAKVLKAEGLSGKVTKEFEEVEASLRRGYPVIADLLDSSVLETNQRFDIAISKATLRFHRDFLDRMGDGHSVLIAGSAGDGLLVYDSAPGLFYVLPKSRVASAFKDGNAYGTLVEPALEEVDETPSLLSSLLRRVDTYLEKRKAVSKAEKLKRTLERHERRLDDSYFRFVERNSEKGPPRLKSYLNSVNLDEDFLAFYLQARTRYQLQESLNLDSKEARQAVIQDVAKRLAGPEADTAEALHSRLSTYLIDWFVEGSARSIDESIFPYHYFFYQETLLEGQRIVAARNAPGMVDQYQMSVSRFLQTANQYNAEESVKIPHWNEILKKLGRM